MSDRCSLRGRLRISGVAALLLLALGRVVGQIDPSQANPGQAAAGQAPLPQVSANDPGSIRGTAVFEDTGGPVRHAKVLLLSTNQGSMTSVGMTDARGAFVLRKVKPGTYFISVDAPGCISPFSLLRTKDIMSGQPDVSALDGEVSQLTVDAGREATVTLQIRRGGAISGRILYDDGSPAADVSISILRRDDPDGGQVVTGFESAYLFGQKTDDRGVYRVSGLPSGDYLVRANEPSVEGGTQASLRNTLAAGGSLNPVFFDKAASAETSTPIHVDPGVEVENIDIRLPDYILRSVSGVVVAQSDGHPLRNARVQIQPKQPDKGGGGLLSATSDDQGAWNFDEVPEGDYTLTISPPADTRSEAGSGDSAGQTSLEIKSTDITVKDNDIIDLKIELQGKSSQNANQPASSQQPSGTQNQASLGN